MTGSGLGARLKGRIRAMSSRDRRALVVGGLVLLPLLGWGLVARPYVAAVAELRDRTELEASLLERERAVLRQAPTLPARLEETRLALSRWEARMVRTPNLPLAEAEVTSLLQGLARESRVHLEEVRAAAPPPGRLPPPGLAPIRLSIRGESDFQGILHFLGTLEEEALLLRVESISVQPAPRAPSSQGGDAAPGGGEPGAMMLTLVVEAFAPAETTG
ncbi:MAG: hypothetical protein EA350_06100 [Gemmatimonadales bacterium]|nr:MAG: hypothetical protein EA350_06100 [Gemmatimonadales bacterium]